MKAWVMWFGTCPLLTPFSQDHPPESGYRTLFMLTLFAIAPFAIDGYISKWWFALPFLLWCVMTYVWYQRNKDWV